MIVLRCVRCRRSCCLGLPPHDATIAGLLVAEAPHLFAPHLLDVEVAQVIRRHVRSGAVRAADAITTYLGANRAPRFRPPPAPAIPGARVRASRQRDHLRCALSRARRDSRYATLVTRDRALASVPACVRVCGSWRKPTYPVTHEGTLHRRACRAEFTPLARLALFDRARDRIHNGPCKSSPISRNEYPTWVKLSLWGLTSRTGVVTLAWASLAAALGLVTYAAVEPAPRFYVGALFMLAAVAYWRAIVWVDRHGSW